MCSFVIKSVTGWKKTYKKDEPFYKGPSLFISSALGLARKFPSNPK